MADPFSGGFASTKQEQAILQQAEDRKASSFKTKQIRERKEKEAKKGEKNGKPPMRVSEAYKSGVALMESAGFYVEPCETGDHCKHRILRPSAPPAVKGITYPNNFFPLQDISEDTDFEDLEACFNPAVCPEEVRTFWLPMYKPKAGDSELVSFTERYLKMKRASQEKNLHGVLEYGHSFDPAARWGGSAVCNPRTWVPDRAWFDPALHDVTIADIFSIFPEAEREMLTLIIGRIGVGRTNHLPPGKSEPVDHTARMAGVIVGKDAG